jgi:LysM repeat protein
MAGTEYCVIGTVSTGAPTTTKAASTTTNAATSTTPPTTTKATTTLPTTTTSGTAPGPTQPGLAADCTKFHQVASGDQCSAIESQYQITASDFAKWNPYIDAGKGI